MVRTPPRGPGEPLEEEGLEQGDELGEVHVALLSAAVVHDRAEDHVDERRIGQVSAQHLPRREIRDGQVEIVVGSNMVHQSAEAVDLAGEGLCYLLFEQAKVVAEAQAAVREAHLRPVLLAKVELVTADAQLPQQFGQWCRLHARRYKVGQGVQADVELAAGPDVVGVEPAADVVPLDNADAAVEVG